MVAEPVTTECREQILMSYTVECVLEIQSEDTQREMYIFCISGYVPHCGHGVEDRIACHPTVLRGREMQFHEWSEPSNKVAG